MKIVSKACRGRTRTKSLKQAQETPQLNATLHGKKVNRGYNRVVRQASN